MGKLNNIRRELERRRRGCKHLVLIISEVVEPTISLEIVTHVLEVRGTDIQNGFITHKHLDEELVDLHEMCMEELGIHESKMQDASNKQQGKNKIWMRSNKCLPTHKDIGWLEIKVIHAKPIIYATCKVFTHAFGGWWLVLRLISWICAQGGWPPLQQPRLLYPWGDWIGGRMRSRRLSNSSCQCQGSCAGKRQGRWQGQEQESFR